MSSSVWDWYRGQNISLSYECKGQNNYLRVLIFLKCPQGASSTLEQCLKDEGLDLYPVQLQDEMLCVFGEKGTQFACVKGIVASACVTLGQKVFF